MAASSNRSIFYKYEYSTGIFKIHATSKSLDSRMLVFMLCSPRQYFDTKVNSSIKLIDAHLQKLEHAEQDHIVDPGADQKNRQSFVHAGPRNRS